MAGFVLVFALVMAGQYVLFRYGLGTLLELRVAGPPLTLYFLESLLVLLLLLSLVSFLASGLWIFYRAHDTAFLLTSPLSLGGLFALRAVETLALTAWPVAVVGLPALLALGVAFRPGAAFYVTGALLFLALAVLAAAAGALLTTGAAAALRRAPSRLAVAAVVAVVIAGFAALVGTNVVPSKDDFLVIFEPGLANGKPASIKFIERKFWLWPTHPFAAALYEAATGGQAGSPLTRAAVWLAPLALVLVAATLGRRLYARTLPVIAERFSLARAPDARTGWPPRPFPRWLRGPVGALIERELLGLARNPHEWSRAGFLLLLLVLYTSFIAVAPLGEIRDRPDVVARLLLLDVVATGYFLTAFGLRFAFPSLSLEGRAAWVLFSSPVPLGRVLLAKLALVTALLTLAVVPVAMAGVLRFVRDPGLALAVAGLLLLLVATTATLLLAAGALWPDFREPNPDALSTSGGGLAATLLCLAYGAGLGWVAYRMALAVAVGAGPGPWLAGAALGSAALVGGALALTARRLRTLEVT